MDTIAWRKASYSGGNGGSCIEVGDAPRSVIVRDTKQQHLGDARTVLSFDAKAWRRFIASVR